MNLQRFLAPLGAAILLIWAGYSWGWMGIFAVISAGVMWALLHFTRLIQTMKRATRRPIGFVDSAVMLNAKLKAGVSLLHVIALTRALGQPESAIGEQPEVFSWRDGSQSVVRCVFVRGKLQSWTLQRPFNATDVEPVSLAANDERESK